MDLSLSNIDFGAVGVVVAIATFIGTILFQEQKRREDLLRAKLDELSTRLSEIQTFFEIRFWSQR